MALEGQNVLITGASMGIGRAMAIRFAQEGAAQLFLVSRSEDKLRKVKEDIEAASNTKVSIVAVDIQKHGEVEKAVESIAADLEKDGKHLDVLVNNAGLAVGAPAIFPDLTSSQISTMIGTNISGMLSTTYAVLNQGGMKKRKHGTILNVTSVTGLEVPPFPGEAIYHTAKAAQEGFTNALRVELVDTSIKVLALRPGVVATHFHQQRVGYDAEAYNVFIEGYEPLVADDVAASAVFMLSQEERVCIKALDVVPTAQRSLACFDRDWTKRNEA
ncbi:NADP-dependent 3-hydroxy acid dehydrogenase [Hondaea fermentalgiana]|uniref:NADP-dependent 3-hydroxy acid dehydrogenase n=1 Tax=Hondaea fermentalgiana TaxID=2315210 RepID=A0A2R5GA43_9STRA|nr:NADP-dependent 3-hydroxy acid dehydrogenase [Hondaea fermentalgiana]|eukprot:GBG27890.1 NADP-dependent 3-hydroxy acid dehydrogenase [Hondaea fermentalgiana]